MKQKHILVVSQYFFPESFRINDICCDLVKRGYKVTVLTGIPNYPQGEFYEGYGWNKKRRETWNGIDIIRIPLIARGKSKVTLALNYLSFVVSGAIWKIATSIKADCVFTFALSPMTQALISVWFSKRRKIPHYIYVQDLWPESVQAVLGTDNKLIIKPLEVMVKHIYKNSRRIFATSESFVKDIQMRVDDNKEKVVYLPQYAEEFFKPVTASEEFECLKDNNFKVVFAGNIGKAQGLGVLPEVAAKLKEKNETNIRFVIVGDGRDKENFLNEINNHNCEDMFYLIDRQPPEKIPGILAACEVSFLSYMEAPLFERSIPAKLQSYLACGRPILAVAQGETQSIIEEAKCGVCCKYNDIEGIANAIIELRDNIDLSILSANSKRYYDANFVKEQLMDKLESLIND